MTFPPAGTLCTLRMNWFPPDVSLTGMFVCRCGKCGYPAFEFLLSEPEGVSEAVRTRWYYESEVKELTPITEEPL
jgi:hypothetical protein